MTTPNQQEKWEEEFGDFWQDMYFRLETFEPHKPMLPSAETAREVKSFISSLIDRTRKEERERLAGSLKRKR